MFKGFNVKYPEYEVITPQTNLSFVVRSLNVSEEERLKGSFMTPSKITEHLNKCLFDAIVSKPQQIKTYDDFLKKVTLKDRDAILYGLYHITYEDIRNYNIRCGACGKEYPVKVKASETFNMNQYPGKDILKERVEVPLEKTPGVTAFIKQATLFEEITSLKTLGGQPASNLDIITESLVIDRFEQLPETGDVIVYDERGDVIDAYMALPSKDKRLVNKKYIENFGQYGIELKMKSACIHCGAEDIINIDLFANFFRMVYEVQ
jgi:hypothetical protein